jgi:hypothetical protein
MNLLAMIFAAVGFAALRRGEWFSEISNLDGVRGLIFVNSAESFLHLL